MGLLHLMLSKLRGARTIMSEPTRVVEKWLQSLAVML